MARNIAVADDVYDRLKKLKRKNESFSDVIRRLLPPRGQLMEIAGTKTFTDAEWEEVEKAFQDESLLDEQRTNEILKKMKEE